MAIIIQDADGNQKKVAGRGGKGAAISDDYINKVDTWSSEKIVNSLCPPFTETGNPVTCNPVEDYPLDVTVTMEPIQEGTGDPSPDNVRPISGRDSVQVTRCGKNLFGDCLNEWVGINGQISVSSISFSTKFIPCEEKDIFCLSTSAPFVPPPGNAACFCFYDGNKQFLSRTSYSKGESFATISAPSNARYVRASCYNPLEDKIQLELGSTPTDYEPYQGDTYALTMPETIYGGEVDAVSGVGSKEWGFIASYNGEALPGEWISDRDVYASGTTPTTGAQVAYKLATPEPFQATGNQPIPAIVGENTVYTDGDSLSVSGRSNPGELLKNMNARSPVQAANLDENITV